MNVQFAMVVDIVALVAYLLQMDTAREDIIVLLAQRVAEASKIPNTHVLLDSSVHKILLHP